MLLRIEIIIHHNSGRSVTIAPDKNSWDDAVAGMIVARNFIYQLVLPKLRQQTDDGSPESLDWDDFLYEEVRTFPFSINQIKVGTTEPVPTVENIEPAEFYFGNTHGTDKGEADCSCLDDPPRACILHDITAH